MKSLMIFLPGKGQTVDLGKYDIIKEIAIKRNAELIGINAPFPHKNGFKWFEKMSRLGEEEVINQFNQSVEYLTSKVDEEVKKRKISYDDIVFCGHSQGGFMAINVGITAGAKEIITLCSDFPYGFEYTTPIRKDVPITWIKAENDGYLSRERQDSYKTLQNWGCNIKRIVSPKSSHDYFDKEILKLI